MNMFFSKTLTSKMSAESPNWAEELRSPTNNPFLSPARKGCYHGLGLTVAVDRARQLSISLTNCSSLLYDIATVYENAAKNLIKSCEVLERSLPDLLIASNSSTSSDQNSCDGVGTQRSCSVVDGKKLREFIRCFTRLGKQMQGLMMCIRSDISRPLHIHASKLGDVAPKLFAKYADSREEAYKKRLGALKLKADYEKAMRKAEQVLSELESIPPDKSKVSDDPLQSNQHNIGSNNTSEKPTTVKAADLLSKVALDKTSLKVGWDETVKIFSTNSNEQLKRGNKLKQAQTAVLTLYNSEQEYLASVDEENATVSRSQTAEVVGLKALQKLEEDRIEFFQETLVRFLQADKGALDNMEMLISSTENMDICNMHNFDLLPLTVDIDEMDTLDIDEVVKGKRNAILRCIVLRKMRLQSVKAMSVFVHNIKKIFHDAALQIRDRLAYDGYTDGKQSYINNTRVQDLLAQVLKQIEGKRLLKSWNLIIKTLVHSSKSASIVEEKMKPLCEAYGDSKISVLDKELKSLSESEDMRWKHLSAALKSEKNAREKYNASCSELEKAKERFEAISNDGLKPGLLSSDSINPSMRKAIGSVISVIPGVDDDTMAKVLTADERNARAKVNLDDAIFNEASLKSLWKATLEPKNKAQNSYVAASKTVIAASMPLDEVGWNDLGRFLEEIYSIFGAFRINRIGIVDKVARSLSDDISPSIEMDIVEWVGKMKLKLKQHYQNIETKESTSPGDIAESYLLKFERQDVPRINALLELCRCNEGRIESEVIDNSFRYNSSTDAVEQIEYAKDVVSGASNCTSTDTDLDSTGGIHNSVSMPHLHEVEVIAQKEIMDESNVPSKQRSYTDEIVSTVTGFRNEIDPSVEKEPTAVSSVCSKVDSSKGYDEVFQSHFYPEADENEDSEQLPPPSVIESFSCAYWPHVRENHFSPLLHGRMFVTSPALYFVGWEGKKIILKWEEVISVSKETTFYGLVPNAILLKRDDQCSYLFGSFVYREQAFDLLKRMAVVAQSLNEISGRERPPKKVNSMPDDILKKMDIVVDRTIPGSTVSDVFKKWQDKEFYHQWLKDQNNLVIMVGDWDASDEGFYGEWCKEDFSYKRTVTYQFKRTSHLYIGPPVAAVTQTQLSRIEDDKLVITSTVAVKGVPYGDTFVVEERWVAFQVSSDVQVKVGVFVNFKKSTMMSGKIKSATITESQAVQNNFFESVRGVCATGVLQETESVTIGAHQNLQHQIIQYLSNYGYQGFKIIRSLDDFTRILLLVLLFFLIMWKRNHALLSDIILELKSLQEEVALLREEILLVHKKNE